MPRTRVGSVAHAGCTGHPLTPARSRGGAAAYIWAQFAAKPSRAASSITNKKRQYKIGSSVASLSPVFLGGWERGRVAGCLWSLSLYDCGLGRD